MKRSQNHVPEHGEPLLLPYNDHGELISVEDQRYPFLAKHLADYNSKREDQARRNKALNHSTPPDQVRPALQNYPDTDDSDDAQDDEAGPS